jgi:hypothetical protein
MDSSATPKVDRAQAIKANAVGLSKKDYDGSPSTHTRLLNFLGLGARVNPLPISSACHTALMPCTAECHPLAQAH